MYDYLDNQLFIPTHATRATSHRLVGFLVLIAIAAGGVSCDTSPSSSRVPSSSRTKASAGCPNMSMPSSAPMNSDFGWRPDPFGSGQEQFHNGVDFWAAHGSPVLAASGGVVTEVGDKPGGNGIYIRLEHGRDGYGPMCETLYLHLSGVAVKQGQTVGQGQTIGYVGSTGNSTGPHLHFTLKDYLQGEEYDDPCLVLPCGGGSIPPGTTSYGTQSSDYDDDQGGTGEFDIDTVINTDS